MNTGEGGLVELVPQRSVAPAPADGLIVVAAHENESAAGPARFVGARGGNMRLVDGTGVQACDDQTGNVGDVSHQIGVDTVGDLPKALEVDGSGVGRGAADDQFGLILDGLGFNAGLKLRW